MNWERGSCNWPKARPDRHRYRDPKPSPSIISVIISSINIVVAQPTRRHPLSEQRNRQRAPPYREALRPEDGKRVMEAVHWDNRRLGHFVVSIWIGGGGTAITRRCSMHKRKEGLWKQPGGGSKKYQAHLAPLFWALLVWAEGQLSLGCVRCREDEGQAMSL